MTDIESDGGRPRSKVARVIERYGLEEVGQELEARWLDTSDQGMSTRQLADFFNEQVLTAAVEASELSVLDVDVGRVYEQLTDDDVSGGERTRTKRRLDRNGVDVDQVTSDFVSHQSIHNYLREYREVEQPTKTAEERREAAIERIQKLQDRTVAVTEDTLQSLQREEIVPEGDVDVLVDIQVVYGDTGDQYTVFELLQD